MYKLKDNIEKFSYRNIPELSSKSVVIRSCLNADVDESGKVLDKTRITEALEGIKYFAQNAKQVVIIGHLGRPKSFSKEESFWNIHEILEYELGEKIKFIKHGEELLIDQKIVLIDNIRFFSEEESDNVEVRENFAKRLASFGDIFVNDAFPDYRKSASTYDIAKFSREKYIGPKFLQEITELNKLNNPERPFVAVLGGAKLSEKLDTLSSLIESTDKILVGGAMAYTFMKAKGLEIGGSLYEEDKLKVAEEILEKYSSKLILPIDHKAVDKFDDLVNRRKDYIITSGPEVKADDAVIETNINDDNLNNYNIAVDIGPKTIQLFEEEISKAGSILWNGPMGVFKWEHSEWGTKYIAKAIVNNINAYKLVGGGDSISAINKFGVTGFDHISTGGGAMLAFLAYDKFPTLDVILNR